ncbi:MAG: hypothetical protein JWM68_3067 [Verrucomicrobiales bacterium]|nr:hypothetical protein [Verrucomicrobiales bacterium]
MTVAFFIYNSKCVIVLLKGDVTKWNQNYAVLYSVEIAQLKFSARKLRIPSDAIQEFMDRRHNLFSCSKTWRYFRPRANFNVRDSLGTGVTNVTRMVCPMLDSGVLLATL